MHKFDPTQFTPTKGSTAQDKAKFANDFMAFVRSDFDRKKWNEAFYARLSLTFGHIAHYDLEGFWNTFFDTADHQRQFFDHTLRYTPAGDPTWTFSDVERAIQQALQQYGMQRIENRLRVEKDAADRVTYERLKAKFEHSINQ